MYDLINSAVQAVNDVVWGWPMIYLLLGTHVFLTFRTGFIQRFTILKGIRLSVAKDPDAEGEVSQFGALTTALAATIGTGNIVGVGTAIAIGGPGAVLWCWLTGVFGIATKYAEAFIAVKYRVKTKDGRMQGGAMYALERGLNMKWLGMAFAILAGFVYLLVRRVIKPYITLSILATVAIFSGIFWAVNPAEYTDPLFNLLTGGLLLGSVFMATDYVTSPMSNLGGVIFGVGIGVLTMLIRYFGAYPEGVSFAILIMNSTVPLINKWCHSRKYGRA